ncbi:MAG: ACP S-malonyltransferase [Dermatophilaceae bacterium]
MKITMLLSGQGEIPSAETVAMWRTDADAVAVWDEAEDAVGPIRQWLDEGVPSDTLRAQLISAVGSLATYAVVRRELGLVPRFVIGHSVGEVAAIGIGLGLDVATVARFVRARGQAMLDAIAAGEPMGMRAVVNPPADLDELVAGVEGVWVANRNSAKQIVVSGTTAALATLVEQTGLATVPLKVTGAFHTPLMAPAAEALRADTEARIPLAHFGPTVIANRTATAYRPGDDVTAELIEQVVSPVLWADCVANAYDHGSQVFLDLSSTGMLARMSDLTQARHLAVGTPDGIARAAHDLRHVRTIEGEYDLAAHALGVIVTTKNRQRDEALYRETVIPSYQELRAMAGKPQEPAKILDIVDRVLTIKAVDEETRVRKLADLRWRADRLAA